VLHWATPAGAMIPPPTERDLPALAVVVGAPGPVGGPGPQGPVGPSGVGFNNYDPGDIILDFENALL
jgi:hypothetical protein